MSHGRSHHRHVDTPRCTQLLCPQDGPSQNTVGCCVSEWLSICTVSSDHHQSPGCQCFEQLCVWGGLRNWNRGARALFHSWACICHMQTPSDYLPQFSFWQMLPSCSQKRLWHFIIDNNVGEGQASLYCSVRLMSILRKASITIHPPGWHGSRLLLVQRHSCPPPPALF